MTGSGQRSRQQAQPPTGSGQRSRRQAHPFPIRAHPFPQTVPTVTRQTRHNRPPFGSDRRRDRQPCRRSRPTRATTARRAVRAVRTGSRLSRVPASPCAVPVRRGDGFGRRRVRHHAADGIGRIGRATVPVSRVPPFKLQIYYAQARCEARHEAFTKRPILWKG